MNKDPKNWTKKERLENEKYAKERNWNIDFDKLCDPTRNSFGMTKEETKAFAQSFNLWGVFKDGKWIPGN